MIDIPVTLFPHTQITAPDLKKILALFEQLTICQPWFMEAPLPVNETGDLSFHVLQPHINLKPKGDFKRLLSEYQLWIRQNQDKGYGAFLSATQGMSLSEATPWEIRQVISKMGRKDSSDPLEDQTLKWHLIIHLAREFEENRVEAEKMLNKLRHQKSPLEGALEEAPPQGLFKDMSFLETQLQANKHQLRQVFEAWFGLFGEHVSGHGTLITFDQQAMNYATEISTDAVIQPGSKSEESFPPEFGSSQARFSAKHLPRLSNDGNEGIDPVIKGLSGKTIILMED